ncbi:MAG TPA: PadR family transcriptional regulator [Gemmatimonadaceae bacterium]|jgi:transcriptional regulator|nr:PadR family transcriptional regulator [Gemmatimonadaceae bacterium]
MTDGMPVQKGNLDMLVLKALSWDEMHGFEILEWLERRSGGRLDIDDSAVYQALHRLEERELVRAEWGVSDKNRQVRFYRLTAPGRAQLRADTSRWTEYAQMLIEIMRGERKPA